MNEPAETVTLTWHHLRTLLESTRNGDSVTEAMLHAEIWNLNDQGRRLMPPDDDPQIPDKEPEPEDDDDDRRHPYGTDRR